MRWASGGIGIRATLKMLSAKADEGSIPSWPTCRIRKIIIFLILATVRSEGDRRPERDGARRGRGIFTKKISVTDSLPNFCLKNRAFMLRFFR